MYFIASDHAGYALKQSIKSNFPDIKWQDLGCDNSTTSVDYPDYAYALGKRVWQNDKGILICGSGIGVAIAANRFPHIRAAQVFSPEMARCARSHNDANVLVLGARFMDTSTALGCCTQFLSTNFDGGRHQRRVDKLSDPQTKD
jgi:ribose 5-phosphate isomerase B